MAADADSSHRRGGSDIRTDNLPIVGMVRMSMLLEHFQQLCSHRRLQFRTVPRDLDLAIGVPWISQAASPVKGKTCR